MAAVTRRAGNCRLGRRPGGNAGYLEAMANAIFRMGFSRIVVEKKWPEFIKAFAGFSVKQVAKFGANDVRRLMSDSGIIRNFDKIKSVIENAKVMHDMLNETGSFSFYLDQMLKKSGEEELIKDLGRRFSRLGPKTALVFLRMTGYEMAQTMKSSKKRGKRRNSYGSS